MECVAVGPFSIIPDQLPFLQGFLINVAVINTSVRLEMPMVCQLNIDCESTTFADFQ
jgi:hypothetical protein